MQKNYYEIAEAVLTDPSTAQHFLEMTENLLSADAFNASLVFANGLAALQAGQITPNTVQCVEILKSNPSWVPTHVALEILPKLENILATHPDAAALEELRLLGLISFPINKMDYSRPLEEYSTQELVDLASSDIEEYAKYREFFDRHHDDPSLQKLPQMSSGETAGHDIKLELTKAPSTKPLVIFFQGFFSTHCPPNLRIPSFQIPFSQEALCRRLDPQCEKFSRIFVRDHFQVWYQAGLHGRGSAITLAWQLASMVDAIAPSRAITYGTSAGGFASLLFGHLLGANTSISFSPQTVVLEGPVRSYMNDYRDLFYSRFLAGKPYLIPDIAKLQPFNQKARVFYSLQNEDDRYHAQRLLPDANLELLERPSDTHGGYLDKELAENELLRALLD